MRDINSASMRKIRAMTARPLTEEDKQKARRVVCGARAVDDAKEAAGFLEMLGLIERTA